MDAVHSGRSMQWNSGIWWWDIVFDTKRSNQWTEWMQYAVDGVCNGIVVYGGGDIAFGAKRVKPVDTVCSGHSGIVVYGGGDIVFGKKRSNQWIQWTQSHSGHSTQWMQYIVDAVCSRIVVYGGGDIVFDTKRSKQWMQYAVLSGHSRIVIYGGGDSVFGTKRSNQWMYYGVDAVE